MIKNKLFYKISLGYIIIVAISLIIVGTFFINMFRSYSFAEKERNMLNRAKDITKLSGIYLSGSIDTKEYDDFIELLDSFTSSRVWITDNHGNMLFMSRGQNCPTMPSDMSGLMCEGMNADMDLIEAVLKGTDLVNQRYSTYYNTQMLIIGTPIYSSSGAILGTVFLHSPVKEITSNINKAYTFLFTAVFIAVVLTGIMGLFYSRLITKPIMAMNTTAKEMAKGNYKVLTNIKQEDEIGQLSSSIDNLATELDCKISEIEKLEQMRKDLISNVSHEFRTPLTLIRGSAEALMDEVYFSDEDKKRQYLRIQKEAKGLERLVNDLLDLSRLQSGIFDMRFEDVDLVILVNDVVKSLQTIADKKNIILNIKASDNIPPISGDYYRLRQLLIILLDNAIKYSYPNSRIDLDMIAADKVIIRMKDCGVGIPKEELPYIWERFYKVDKSRSGSYSGAGLGLTIAKYLVEGHHGIIKAESELGKGTTMEIELPKK
jgi:signal transduction histidine kinase